MIALVLVGIAVLVVLVVALEAWALVRARHELDETIVAGWKILPTAGVHAAYVTPDGIPTQRLAIWAMVEKVLRDQPEATFIIAAPHLGPGRKYLSRKARRRAVVVPSDQLIGWIRSGDVTENMIELVRSQREVGTPVHVLGLYSDIRLELGDVTPQELAKWESDLSTMVSRQTDVSVICGYRVPSLVAVRQHLLDTGKELKGYDELLGAINGCHNWEHSLVLGHDTPAETEAARHDHGMKEKFERIRLEEESLVEEKSSSVA